VVGGFESDCSTLWVGDYLRLTRHWLFEEGWLAGLGQWGCFLSLLLWLLLHYLDVAGALQLLFLGGVVERVFIAGGIVSAVEDAVDS
jgi:hypothetical protein